MSDSGSGHVRLTVEMSVGTAQSLASVARARGCAVSQALGAAIRTHSALLDHERAGGKLLLRSSEGELTEARFVHHQ